MNSLAAVLNKFQQRFTYRQRFLFFAALFFIATPLPTYWAWMTLRAQIALKDHQIVSLNNYMIIKDLPNQILTYSLLENENDISNLHIKISDSFSTLDLNTNVHFDHVYSIGKSFYPYAPIQPIIDKIKTSIHELLALKTSNSIQDEDIPAIKSDFEDQLFDLVISSGVMSDPTLPYPAFLDFTFQNKIRNTNFLNEEYERLENVFGDLNGLVYNALIIMNRSSLNNGELDPADRSEIRNLNMALLIDILKTQRKGFLWHYYGFLFLLIFITTAVVIFVIIKVLTRHLLDLLNHIQTLASGNFSTRFYPQSDDEFSQVGLSLNEMAKTLADISGRIHTLGLVLAASSEHLSYEVMSHETNIHDQESIITNTANIANTIASDCHGYVKIINELSNSALQQPLTLNAKKSLSTLKNTLEEISRDSQNTLDTLREVQLQLQEADQRCSLMRKVSEEAHMLALNASIEANISGPKHPQFSKIAQAIQQFTERTTQSTTRIDATLKETSQDINQAENTIQECLTEMNHGRSMLISIDNQLHSIGQQVVLQMEKFEEFNTAMKKQAFEAESIIEGITYIRKNAISIAEIFHQLNDRVKHLGEAARELRRLLEVFFSEPKIQR